MGQGPSPTNRLMAAHELVVVDIIPLGPEDVAEVAVGAKDGRARHVTLVLEKPRIEIEANRKAVACGELAAETLVFRFPLAPVPEGAGLVQHVTKEVGPGEGRGGGRDP